MATLHELTGPPPPLADAAPDLQTGNHHIWFPRIAAGDGSIHGINVVHRGLNGVVEWSTARRLGEDAAPLLRVDVSTELERGEPAALEWQYIDGWIPRYTTRRGAVRVVGTVCAPGGVDPLVRGGLIALELSNDGVRDQNVEIVLDGAWRWTLLSMLTPRPLRGENRLIRSPGLDAIVLEAADGGAGAALAVCESLTAGRDAVATPLEVSVAALDGELTALEPGAELVVPNGALLRFRLRRRLRIGSRRRVTIAFHLGAAPERDGAVGTAAALRRLGSDELLHLARLDLARLTRRLRDPELGALFNRNLIFNYYGSVGRGIDDDLLYPLLARSALHGPTAAMGERAALLWSLPAITLVDRALAREALVRCFEQYSARAGEQWKYLDGAVLAPGLQLDQICAYVLALDRYVAETEDASVLDEPLVQEVLREIDELLYSLLDREVFLCATELLPSGETPDHDYTTFGNVLVWAAARALPRLWQRYPDEPPPRFFEGAADEVSAAIWQRCAAEIDGVPVLGYSSDLNGRIAIYDDPEGSLALLPFLGFCDADDPIWTNTMELLRSSSYPLWLHDRRAAGLASRSDAKTPRLAALCADLLGPRSEEARAVLRSLAFPHRLATPAWDADTGAASGAPPSPPLGGLLAWTLHHAMQPRALAAATNGQRR